MSVPASEPTLLVSPAEANDYERWSRREAELREYWASFDVGDPQAKEMFIQNLLMDEIAAESGADPAVMKAEALVRQHGLRRARRAVGGGSAYLHFMATHHDDDESVRVADYLDEMWAALPWWKRLLA